MRPFWFMFTLPTKLTFCEILIQVIWINQAEDDEKPTSTVIHALCVRWYFCIYFIVCLFIALGSWCSNLALVVLMYLVLSMHGFLGVIYRDPFFRQFILTCNLQRQPDHKTQWTSTVSTATCTSWADDSSFLPSPRGEAPASIPSIDSIEFIWSNKHGLACVVMRPLASALLAVLVF